jgi:hypothetical protein
MCDSSCSESYINLPTNLLFLPSLFANPPYVLSIRQRVSIDVAIKLSPSRNCQFEAGPLRKTGGDTVQLFVREEAAECLV